MGSSTPFDSLELDVETTAGRSSEEESESERFLDQKSPLLSTDEIDDIFLENLDDCPFCRRKPFWKKPFMSMFWRRAQSGCKHDRRAIREYHQTTSPVRIRRRTRKCTICFGILTFIFALFGLYNMITILIGLGPLLWDPDFDDFFPNWGQKGEPGEGMSGYPTDFTRDVLPIPCHSHNDYWRRVPLFSAIHYGCTGVEADVWLFNSSDELFVGHNTASLSKNRTFRSLYVDPLVKILEDINQVTEFHKHTNKRPSGVFDQDPSQPLVLLVDFKTDGEALFPVVQEQLSTLRERDYLTYFDGHSIIPGAITVVGTGNTPFDLLTANSTYRDIFFDAPLDKLIADPKPRTTGGGQGNVGITPDTNFSIENSYYASVNFGSTIGFPWRGHLSQNQRHKLRSQIKAAHEKGLKARYWNTPAWPIGLRNHIWSILVKEEADMLNVDDLKGASKVDWRRKSERD